jgi:uncharacterized protein YdaL
VTATQAKSLRAPPPPPTDQPTQPNGYQTPTALAAGATASASTISRHTSTTGHHASARLAVSTTRRPAAKAKVTGARVQTVAATSSVTTTTTVVTPPQAKTWGTSGSATTLVVYDSTGAYGYLGELYAENAGNLASHFGKVTAEPVIDYQAGQVNNYTATIYLGSTYNEPIPATFLNDALSTTKPVLWAGDNIWQLSGTGAADTAFQAKYGWDPSTSYFDSVDTVSSVTYNGQTLTRNPTSGMVLAPHLTSTATPSPVTVLGQANCTTSAGVSVTCNSIAQSTGTTFPWAIASSNLTYVGEIPFSYATEADRYLAFSDLLYRVLAPSAPTVRQALVRLEDVSPGLDTPAELEADANYLYSVHVPFSVGVIPDYTDPNNAEGDGVVNENISQTTNATIKAFDAALVYMEARGGTIIEHGYTHQYSNIANPYDAVSGDDFEFYRAQCSPTEYAPHTFDDPCPNTDWVIEEGPLPSDSQAWAEGRAATGQALFAKAGLPTPTIWETPHYAASAADYAGIGQVFKIRYERDVLFGGLLTPGAAVNYTHVFGQFFPYTVQDVYGSFVIPEDLGNYEPTEENNNPPKPPSYIIGNAKAELAVRQGVASFFFHPYYSVTYLKQIVVGIQALGYKFVSAPSTEAPTVTTPTLAAGNVGSPYSQQLGATAGIGAEKWSVSSGTLPAGLTLNATTGVISGTPTKTATTSFTVKVTDSATPTANSATQALTLTINAALPPPLTITTTSLPAATVGVAYSQTLTSTGGAGVDTWSVSQGTLPPGLVLNAATGVVSGTPTALFNATVTFRVTDGETPTPATATQGVSLVVGPASGTTVPLIGVYLDSSGYRGPGVAIFGLTVACSTAVSGTVTIAFTMGGVSDTVTSVANCPASGAAYVGVQVPGGWSAGTATVNATYRAAGQTAQASGSVAIS